MELSLFRSDALRRTSFLYVAWLILLLDMAYVLYRYDFRAPLDHVSPAIFLYFLAVTVHVFRRVIQGGTANLLAPDILFIAVYSIFHQGYLVLWTFGIVPYSDIVFYNIETVPISLLIVNLGLLSAMLGFELFGRWRPSAYVSVAAKVPAPGWGMTGFAVMILGTAMHTLTLLAVGIDVFIRHGYTAVARLNEHVGGPWPLIWSRSTQVFLLGITLYTVYSSLRYRRLFGSKAPLILAVGTVALFVLEGDRGPVFLVALSLLIIRHYLIRPFRLYTVIALTAALLLLFTAMKVARSRAFSPGAMVAEWQHARSAGEVHWWSSIAEGGGSFRIASMTTQIVPDYQPYWYGKSWVSAAAKVVPFLQGQLSRMGLLRQAPAQWITYEISGPGEAGLGFSLPVEGYLNFGLPGVVFQMMFFGAILRRVCIWFARSPSAFTALIMFGVLAPTIKLVRDHVSLVTAVYVQVIVSAWLLQKLFGNEPEGLVTPQAMESRPYDEPVPRPSPLGSFNQGDPVVRDD